MVAFGERDMMVNLDCRVCGIPHNLMINRDDIVKYDNGALVQDAFPYLSANERELIISQTCGSCFDKMFGG
jgi:hypothetical protein